MARGEVTRRNLAQSGFFSLAAFLSYWTSGVKTATNGRVGWAGQVSFEQNSIASVELRVWNRRSRNQSYRIGVERRLVNLVTLTDFGNSPQVHYSYAIANISHNVEIMRDKEVGQIELFLQVNQEIEDLRLDRDV